MDYTCYELTVDQLRHVVQRYSVVKAKLEILASRETGEGRDNDNYGDVYDAGVRDGETWLAHELLDFFGEL